MIFRRMHVKCVKDFTHVKHQDILVTLSCFCEMSGLTSSLRFYREYVISVALGVELIRYASLAVVYWSLNQDVTLFE